MATVIITEKSSQAKDLRAALGARFGQILPAEGHLLRLAEPEEVNAAWKSWSCVVLNPEGLYPTRPATGGSKGPKLKAIAAALKACDDVILATDCDREGQLIGQEILEHLGYRGRVRRALFTAQDPKTLQQAFARLKPNAEMRPLYEAAVARQQADQIFNLSLTRTATKTLVPPGVRGVIGIGRVKTPTLAIVCLRELEIVNFRPEAFFEVVAIATVATGDFLMRHAPSAKMRIKERAQAEAIAKAAAGYQGSLSVSVEEKRQAPPRLFDLPSLQKTCGQRWGWTADKTLAIAQELYDGDGKKLITYPRSEARYLSENQIHDAVATVAALTRLRGFAHLEIAAPVIRRGKSGHFCDKALEGVSHHAIVPNVNVLDDLESRLVRLNDDEKRLFALICRSYLAIIMPDYEYRQTVVTMPVPLPDGGSAEFRAVGRVPLRLGWKAVYQIGEAEPDSEAEQTLPPINDGDAATLSETKVEAKRTQPPPRYSEGTLVDAMQNAWRFVEDPALRDRLKEAKGIGTPATRAEIIKGLKRQNLLIAEGKLVAPSPAGLQLFELLRASAPALVDPGTTALWEMRLDEVVTRKADFRAVIDGIAAAAADLIEALQKRSSATISLENSTQTRRSGRQRYGGKTSNRSETKGRKPARTQRRSTNRRVTTRNGLASVANAEDARAGNRKAPTAKMVAYAQTIARTKKTPLPEGYQQDFDACRRFLDEHAK
ncbi:DNA topoisomerase [Methylocystis sp. IM3]|uniref:DNA topoisomerase n=1 Tax=unclassified Methylocystis TaxID=2625913 RepID=UPI0030F5A034